MLSVIIRNKNEAESLSFLLHNLRKRYYDDIDEIIVIDNLSTDSSREVAAEFDARIKTITNFSYGGSANVAAEEACGEIIVIFSAHCYPVSPDFFKVIKEKFQNNANLAGVRCLHCSNDYRNYINDIDASKDPNKSGLIFSGSAFRKSVWQKIPFNEKVPTFEDKEWTLRVLRAGYDIDFAPVVFHYEVKRTAKRNYRGMKNGLLGNYQVWHQEISLLHIFVHFIVAVSRMLKEFLLAFFYRIKFLFYSIKVYFNKPNKLDSN